MMITSSLSIFDSNQCPQFICCRLPSASSSTQNNDTLMSVGPSVALNSGFETRPREEGRAVFRSRSPTRTLGNSALLLFYCTVSLESTKQTALPTLQTVPSHLGFRLVGCPSGYGSLQYSRRLLCPLSTLLEYEQGRESRKQSVLQSVYRKDIILVWGYSGFWSSTSHVHLLRPVTRGRLTTVSIESTLEQQSLRHT